MKAKEVGVVAGVGIVLVAVVAFYARIIVAPTPIPKEKVSLVMLGKALDGVGTAIGPNVEFDQLNCESKGDGKVTCSAVGSAVYRVSFSSVAGAPEFELAGQRAIDGNLYVKDFRGVPAEIPARDVDRFTSAFDGSATVLTP